MRWPWQRRSEPIVVIRPPRPKPSKKRRLVGAAAVSAAALAATPMVQHWEGTRLQAYRDVVGVWTICTGETLNVGPGDVATAADCNSMLAKRLVQFGTEIAPCLPADLPIEMRAAFISTAYNIGSGGFCRSSMSKRSKAGDLVGACDALSLWNKGPVNGALQVIEGLRRRREAERELCMKGANG